MMKIAVIPDSFKGSLRSIQVAKTIAAGIRRADPRAEIIQIPFGDGGEGTVDAFLAACGGERRTVRVHGPLSEPVDAAFGILSDRRTAVIEMAQASGLMLLPPERRNPMKTTTYGTGELIKAALDEGVQKIIVGIGGSATNDAGLGMARALGVRFLDDRDRDIGEGGQALARLAHVDMRQVDPRIREVEIHVACDVDNTLTGPRGAAFTFGPQKGADDGMVRTLDANLAIFHKVVQADLNMDIQNLPGAGAAGGLGAGLVVFAGATLLPGIDVLSLALDIKERIRHCDLVFTGEGKIDGQTVHGKAVMGIAKIAGELDIPLVALCGSLGRGCEQVLERGVASYFSLIDRPMDLSDAMDAAEEKLRQLTEQVMRSILLGGVLGRRRAGGDTP